MTKSSNIQHDDLVELEKLFSKAEDILNSMTDATQDAINGMHWENHSINHCIRRGLQACQELLEN